MREVRDGKPVWISKDENDEDRVERQYQVLNLHGVCVFATVWDGGDFDPVGALGVSLFNDAGFRVWSTVVGSGFINDTTDREAVAEAVRQLKLPRRGKVNIIEHGFGVNDPHSVDEDERQRNRDRMEQDDPELSDLR